MKYPEACSYSIKTNTMLFFNISVLPFKSHFQSKPTNLLLNHLEHFCRKLKIEINRYNCTLKIAFGR